MKRGSAYDAPDVGYRFDVDVLFVDVLGFAQLALRHESALGPWVERPTPLQTVFTRFHEVIKSNIPALEQNEAQAVVFSDSAFICFSDSSDADECAKRLMREFILRHVPVRMGLATGSFQAIRFDTNYTPTSIVYSSQFLGTAVVRAVWAESKSGQKGMRILLHPSRGWSFLNRTLRHPVVPVDASSEHCRAELSYLHESAKPSDIEGPESVELLDAELEAAVRAMAGVAPDSEQHHYADTLAAIGRMRTSRANRWILPPKEKGG